jgi:hypothetical protein
MVEYYSRQHRYETLYRTQRLLIVRYGLLTLYGTNMASCQNDELNPYFANVTSDFGYLQERS